MLTKVLFKDRIINEGRLLDYGFEQAGEEYIYRTTIAKGQMQLSVLVNKNGEVDTEIVDSESGEEYALHLVDDAVGEFVGSIKEEYENIQD